MSDSGCNIVDASLILNEKWRQNDASNSSTYRNSVGSLLCLIAKRPNIIFASVYCADIYTIQLKLVIWKQLKEF